MQNKKAKEVKRMSYTIPIGANAPKFKLKATNGKSYSLEDFQKSKGLLVFFTCNHCPYVLGSEESTRETCEMFKKELSAVAINSNSPSTYPEDSFVRMVERMEEKKFPWIYLYDSSQEVALAYGALKTPHFFLFNEERKLIYTGREVDNPKNSKLALKNDLRQAIKEFLNGENISTAVTNPIGCNIKWEGKPAHWMPAAACDLV